MAGACDSTLPNSAHGADLFEAQGDMQADRTHIFRITNHRNHLPEARRFRARDQFRDQRLTDTLATHIIAHINRILDRKAIG